MKVTVKRSVSVNLELTEEEATILCALVGGVMNCNGEQPAWAFVRDLYNALDNELPDREKLFFDFFEGRTRVKE